MDFSYYDHRNFYTIESRPAIYSWHLSSVHSQWPAKVDLLKEASVYHCKIDTLSRLSYGIQIKASDTPEVTFNKRANVWGELKDASTQASLDARALLDLLLAEKHKSFSRPLYIGITIDARRRIYNEHIEQLISHLRPGSQVQDYIQAGLASKYDIEQRLGHTFALSAALRNIYPSDLCCHVAYLREDQLAGASTGSLPESLKIVEDILQALATPLLGRE